MAHTTEFTYGYRVQGGGYGAPYFERLGAMESLDAAISAAVANYTAAEGNPTPEQERIASTPLWMIVGVMVSDHGSSHIQDSGGRGRLFETLAFRNGEWRKNDAS